MKITLFIPSKIELNKRWRKHSRKALVVPLNDPATRTTATVIRLSPVKMLFIRVDSFTPTPSSAAVNQAEQYKNTSKVLNPPFSHKNRPILHGKNYLLILGSK